MANGPCQPGSYCYPVFSGGYSQLPGQIIAGQMLPGQIVGVGTITGFVCNSNAVGKPGEKFWSGACPGTWGPNGPFYPTSSAPAIAGLCTPPSGKCPAGYRLVWFPYFQQSGTGAYIKKWKGMWVPNNSPEQTPAGCPCGTPSKSPATSGPGSQTTPGGPSNPSTGPQPKPSPGDGCGPIAGSGGSAAKKLFGHDMGEHFEGGAVSANLVTLPVHTAATASAGPNWTNRPVVKRGPNGIYQIWDGTADGNLAVLPPELSDYHAYGDNQTAGAKYPANISGHGLLVLSGARATPAQGDRPDGYLSFGYAHKTKRTPVSGFYWSLASGVLTLRPTDASADVDTAERLVVVDANLQARADIKVPAAANPNTGPYASSTLWADSGDSDRATWGDEPMAYLSDIGGATAVTAASTFGTDNRLLRSDGTGRGAQASGVTLDDNDDMTVPGMIKSSSATDGIGYATGAGGTVTQATSKATTVTLNKVTGEITTHNAALAAGATVSFTVNNSACGTDDTPYPIIRSAGLTTPTAYQVVASGGSGGFILTLTNITTGSLSDAVVIKFVIIKGAAA